MRLPVSLDDQIAYQEGELERILGLFPRLAFARCMSHEALQREIDCQTAILATLKAHKRALDASGSAALATIDRIDNLLAECQSILGRAQGAIA